MSSTQGMIRWLNDGDIIEFTNEWIQGGNRRYNINGDSNHQIWFTQVNKVHFIPGDYNDDWKLCPSYFKFREVPDKVLYIFKLDPQQFSKIVQGKHFKVKALDGYFAINEKSSLYSNKTIGEYIDFIKDKIYYGNSSDLGDLVKCMRAYAFEEV